MQIGVVVVVDQVLTILQEIYWAQMKLVFIMRGNDNMIEVDNFVIHAQKDFIFRREPLFEENEEWITFDPIDLEYYSLNTAAAEIFYIIYLGLSKDEGYRKFLEKYDISYEEYELLINAFIANTYLFKYMKSLTIINGWH